VDVVDAAHAPAQTKLAETQQNHAKLKYPRQHKWPCPAWNRRLIAPKVLSASKVRTRPLKTTQVVHVAHATAMDATAESVVTETIASPAQKNPWRM